MITKGYSWVRVEHGDLLALPNVVAQVLKKRMPCRAAHDQEVISLRKVHLMLAGPCAVLEARSAHIPTGSITATVCTALAAAWLGAGRADTAVYVVLAGMPA